jgi:exodeoxyribonuclease VII small subunit
MQVDNDTKTSDDSFETKIKSAKNTLELLINPEITLEKSVKYYKDGIDELSKAQKLLDEAKFEFEEYTK